MYQGFYRLRDEPFRLTADPAFMCMTAQHQEALAGLVYSVCTGRGLTVLTGEAGTGKTTLLYSLLDLLEKRRFVSAVCTNPIMNREELFDFLIQRFGITCGSTLKNRQLSALQDAFVRCRMEGRPAVLIVDEAQRVPMDLLEEVRLLLNLETPREKLLQIILSGQPELDSILGEPQLRQLKQRVSCYCRLGPLSLPELKEYIGHRLALAGLPQQTLFPEPAMEKIHQYARGIPRLVNTLCDTALQVGFATRAGSITTAIVEEAAKDLVLMPLEPHTDAKMPEPGLPLFEAKQQTNGHAAAYETAGNADTAAPLANYATRQKSMSFFGGLIDRWR